MPHGHCYLWQTPLVSLHVISDAVIAIAYFSIPISLLYFVCKRKHDFPVRLLILFGLFIVLCGIGHLFDIITLWFPLYWISGLIRAATALVSAYTAFEVAILLPYFLSLQDPAILEAINQKLEKTIAEKSVATKELKDSQRTLEGAFRDAPTGMAIVSIEGLFLKVNRALSNVLGYSKKELLSINFQSITHPEDLQADLNLIEDLISGQRRFCQFEKRYIHKLGQAVPVQLNVALLRDSQNKPLYFIVHYQDITQQKQTTASLMMAKRKSEAASQAKSEFLATMSHEIRTPMNAMLGMTELLLDTSLNPQQKDFVEVINNSGNTLLTVINDILDFSKIESNKLELEMGRLDLYECIEDVLALFSHQAEQKGVRLNALIEPASIPDFFRGDSTRLKQIISNLVNNSLKFTEAGEVSIHTKVVPIKALKPKNSAKDLFKIDFIIKDSGIGIPKEKIADLFKPFNQVDTSTTRRYGGTGLGLAISRRLVNMMGGEIGVESELGTGSTFYFSIQVESYNCFEQAKKMRTQTGLKQKRLLVVDRSEISGRYLRLQAESWDLEVEVIASAESAMVQLFRSDPFDAIAIDDSLSDMDNIQLASQIRNFPNYQTIPIILLQSRKASTIDPLKMLGSKIKLLHKPFRRSHFYNALVELLLSETTLANSNNAVEQAMNENFSATKPLRILLTEDIPLNQKVALQMLSTYGYQADIANNGKEAVDALQKRDYDLVFMDVQMPEMDGLEATGRIRSNETIQQPYIIAMTAHAMQGDREECLSAGMDDYISKPIRKRDLAVALHQCPQSQNSPERAKSPAAKSDAARLDKLLELEVSPSGTSLDKPSPKAEEIDASSNQPSPINKADLTPSLPTASSTLPTPNAEAPLYVGVDVDGFPVLDRQILEGVSSEASFLLELCNSFLQDAPERVEQIRQDLSTRDAQTIRASAHALKSLSGCVGAMSLFQVCKFLEDLAKRNCIGSALPVMQQIDTEYQKVKTAIEQYQQDNLL